LLALAVAGAAPPARADEAPAPAVEAPAPEAEAGSAADAAALFARGNAAYEAGDFAAAAAAYDELRGRRAAGAGVLYNLGNAHLRNGDLGRAVASYERALALAPRDAELNENLALARGLCVDRPSAGVSSPALLATRAARRLTPDEWVVILEGAYVLLLASFVVPYYAPLRRSLVRRGRLAAGIVLLVAAAALLAWHSECRPGRRGVVVAPEITVRSGPGTGYLGEFTLHPGSVLRVDERRGEWVKVLYPPSLRGWTEAEGIDTL
jgi:tetratricopeptide (TPR) repeat protein